MHMIMSPRVTMSFFNHFPADPVRYLLHEGRRKIVHNLSIVRGTAVRGQCLPTDGLPYVQHALMIVHRSNTVKYLQERVLCERTIIMPKFQPTPHHCAAPPSCARTVSPPRPSGPHARPLQLRVPPPSIHIDQSPCSVPPLSIGSSKAAGRRDRYHGIFST